MHYVALVDRWYCANIGDGVDMVVKSWEEYQDELRDMSVHNTICLYIYRWKDQPTSEYMYMQMRLESYANNDWV